MNEAYLVQRGNCWYFEGLIGEGMVYGKAEATRIRHRDEAERIAKRWGGVIVVAQRITEQKPHYVH